jgi:adenosylmethionine-8-amino-7-oxononanoate aminotransferase
VACLGHGDKRVIEAMQRQAEEITYCATAFFTTKVCEALCQKLVNTAPQDFSRAYIVSSGTLSFFVPAGRNSISPTSRC